MKLASLTIAMAIAGFITTAQADEPPCKFPEDAQLAFSHIEWKQTLFHGANKYSPFIRMQACGEGGKTNQTFLFGEKGLQQNMSIFARGVISGEFNDLFMAILKPLNTSRGGKCKNIKRPMMRSSWRNYLKFNF